MEAVRDATPPKLWRRWMRAMEMALVCNRANRDFRTVKKVHQKFQ